MSRQPISLSSIPSYQSSDNLQQSDNFQQSDNYRRSDSYRQTDNSQYSVPFPGGVQQFQHQTFPSIPLSASSQYPLQTQQVPFSSAIASSSDHYVRSVYPRLAQSSPPSQHFFGASSGRSQHFLYEPTGRFDVAAHCPPEAWPSSAQIQRPGSCCGSEYGNSGTTDSAASRTHSQSRNSRRIGSHQEALRHVGELQAQLREYQFAASARAQSDHSLRSARCDALSDQSSRGNGLSLQLAYAKADNAAQSVEIRRLLDVIEELKTIIRRTPARPVQAASADESPYRSPPRWQSPSPSPERPLRSSSPETRPLCGTAKLNWPAPSRPSAPANRSHSSSPILVSSAPTSSRSAKLVTKVTTDSDYTIDSD